jgi:hypothetical protein
MSRLDGTPWMSATVRRGRSRFAFFAGAAALATGGFAGAGLGAEAFEAALGVGFPAGLEAAAVRAGALLAAARDAAFFVFAILRAGAALRRAVALRALGAAFFLAFFEAAFRAGFAVRFVGRRAAAALRPAFLAEVALRRAGRAAFFFAMALPFGSLTVRAKYRKVRWLRGAPAPAQT